MDISLSWPDDNQANLVVAGRAVDRVAGAPATASTLEARFGDASQLLSLASDPDVHALGALAGSAVGKGFRAEAEAAIAGSDPTWRDDPQVMLVGQLLDELPVAFVLAGYRSVAARRPDEPRPDSVKEAAEALTGVCVGWQRGSEALSLIARGVAPIAQFPPEAPTQSAIEAERFGTGPLGADSIRRRRTLDVEVTGAGLRVDGWFRDTYRPSTGPEIILHEYDLEVRVDEGLISHAVATPRVLPFGECPSAADNMGRLVGHPPSNVRTLVREQLGGVAGCTHLNDLIRSLLGIDDLVAGIAAGHGDGGR